MRLYNPDLETRRRVYEYILGYKVANSGLSPSMRDIMEGCGLKTTSHAQFLVDSLEREGQITTCANQPRSIRIPGERYLPPELQY